MSSRHLNINKEYRNSDSNKKAQGSFYLNEAVNKVFYNVLYLLTHSSEFLICCLALAISAAKESPPCVLFAGKGGTLAF